MGGKAREHSPEGRDDRGGEARQGTGARAYANALGLNAPVSTGGSFLGALNFFGLLISEPFFVPLVCAVVPFVDSIFGSRVLFLDSFSVPFWARVSGSGDTFLV